MALIRDPKYQYFSKGFRGQPMSGVALWHRLRVLSSTVVASLYVSEQVLRLR